MSRLAESIKDRVSMAAVLNLYGVAVENRGGDQQIRCPFHADTDPSARFYPDTDSVFCWACGKSWDVIEWVKDSEGISFGAAVKFLADSFGVDVVAPDYERRFKRHFAKLITESRSLDDEMKNVGPLPLAAREYLYGRGLTAELVEEFGIGYGRDGRFRKRVVFPFFEDGRLVYAVGRWLGKVPEGQKITRYVGWYGAERLFNADVLSSHSGAVCLCEGVIDALTLIQYDLPAIAVMGKSGFRRDWVVKLQGRRIFVCYDQDEGGRKGVRELFRVVGGRADLLDVRFDYKDVNDLFCTSRAPLSEFKAALANAKGV